MQVQDTGIARQVRSTKYSSCRLHPFTTIFRLFFFLPYTHREDNASAQESESRREAVALKASYEGGLHAAEAITLRAELETSRRELEAAQMESIRYKELSEISSLQAQSIGSFKQQHMDELTSLR